METTPSVLIISNSNTKPASIIKLITKHQPHNNDTNISIHPFQIKTKYYTTTINLIGFNDNITNLDKNASFLNTIEALIIHMDANKPSALEDVDKWTQLFDELEIQPEIKLLLANYCNESTVISKDDANLWCLDKGFEFVELFPPQNETQSGVIEEENELEDAFGEEKVGVDRVLEALENNLWSNMEMSDKDPMSKETEEETDMFFELFSNLMSMKSNISNMPTNVRKQCAEQMVTAFWNAIGGDEDELGDL